MGLTEVEVAPFNPEQVKIFAENWFIAVAKNSRDEGLASANQFLEKLNLPENGRIRELAVTPILLNLACWIYKQTKEFPSQRSQLYERGIDILIREWDEFKFVERDTIYKNLSPEEKKSLLSQVAARAFEKGLYFFDKSEVQGYIADYLGTLPDAPSDIKALQEDSEAVLQAISEQHGLLVERAQGIYSFSHLTFQEYFTARAINLSKPRALQQLANHVTEIRWREVFLLVFDMLQNQDSVNFLLNSMHNRIANYAALNNQLNEFLTWLNEKAFLVADEVGNLYKPVAIRACYFDCIKYVGASRQGFRGRYKGFGGFFNFFSFELRPRASMGFDCDITKIFWLGIDRVYGSFCYRDGMMDDITYFTTYFENTCAKNPKPEYKEILEGLRNQLPNYTGDIQAYNQWWKDNGITWLNKLYEVIQRRHIMLIDARKLSEEQKDSFRQYSDATWFLVDCLRSNRYVTPAVRQEIKDELLLPIVEIEKRRQQPQDSGLVVDE